MLNQEYEWIIDRNNGRAMKVKTKDLISGRELKEEDYICVMRFKELQYILDLANDSFFKDSKDLKERINEKDKIIDKLYGIIERQLKVIESVNERRNNNEI